MGNVREIYQRYFRRIFLKIVVHNIDNVCG